MALRAEMNKLINSQCALNRGISDDEFCGALELARSAGLWRFDTRWSRRRGMIPHGAPVWLPQLRGHQESRVNAG
jgi:hypothetical protein